jgi:hypothetical protein
MAIVPQVIHGYGVPPTMPPPSTPEVGVRMSGGVSVPYQNFHLPTGVIVFLVLLGLIALHLIGFRAGAVVGVGTV